MTAKMIGTIIILVLLLAVIGAGYYLYYRISRKIREVSQMAFGTDNFLEGLKAQNEQLENTPKSIASMTSIYMPRITKDFPEFHCEEMRYRAENVLRSFLDCIDRGVTTGLCEGTQELQDQLALTVNNYTNHNQRAHYSEIRIHQTGLYKYQKMNGRVSVIFQTSVGYKYYLEKNGKIIGGDPDHFEQARYNIEAVYVQDRDVIENEGTQGLGLICPNCGGAIRSLGAKECPYCGSGVVEFNIRTWGFAKIKKS